MEPVLGDPMTAATRLSCPENPSEKLRRKELANFLRTRREALSPVDAGLPRTRRRRVRGLRREEVAELAGISVAWYTWMEQCRVLNLSEATLAGISRALRLTSRECEHLFRLAGHTPPLPAIEESDRLMDSMRQVIGNMDPNPAYVLDSTWNILAWNRGAMELFGDFGAMPEHECNFIWQTFAGSDFRKLFVNWESVARCVMAHFRSDSVGHIGDSRWTRLIEELTNKSPEFKAWWPDHEVTWPMRWQKTVLHPIHGKLTFNTFDLELFRPARLRVVTWIPEGAVEPKLP